MWQEELSWSVEEVEEVEWNRDRWVEEEVGEEQDERRKEEEQVELGMTQNDRRYEGH